MGYRLLKTVLALLVYCNFNIQCDNSPFTLRGMQDIRKNGSVSDEEKTQFNDFFKDPLKENDKYFGIVPEKIMHLIEIYKWNYVLKDKKKVPSLVLFHGPVGIGKSAAAKLIALESKRLYAEIDASLLIKQDKKGIDVLKQVFDIARQAKKPVIIIINEIQAIFNTRESSHERKLLREALERELKQTDSFILCIGETSNFASIDATIKEQCKGFCVEFDFPNDKNREVIIKQYMQSDRWCLSKGSWRDAIFPIEFYKKMVEKTRGMACKEILKKVDCDTTLLAIDIIQAYTAYQQSSNLKQSNTQGQESTIKSFMIDASISLTTSLAAYFIVKWFYNKFINRPVETKY